MQKTLSIEKNGAKIISKPFDFEAMCLVNDAHNRSEKPGILRMCEDALLYMFEGTEADNELIKSLPVEEHSSLCLAVWDFYAEALSSKKK